MQKRPELPQAVLQRGSRQEKACACGQCGKRASEPRPVVLEPVSLVHNHHLPLQQLETPFSCASTGEEHMSKAVEWGMDRIKPRSCLGRPQSILMFIGM